MAANNPFKVKVVERGGKIYNPPQDLYITATDVAFFYEKVDTTTGVYAVLHLDKNQYGEDSILGIQETLSKLKVFMAAAQEEIVSVTVEAIDSITDLDIAAALPTARIHVLVPEGSGSRILLRHGKGNDMKEFLVAESPADLGLAGASS